MKKIILIFLFPFVVYSQKKDLSPEKHFYGAMFTNIAVSELTYQLTGKPFESGLIGFLVTAAGIVFKEEIYDAKLKKGVKTIADYGAGGLGCGTGSELFTVRIDIGPKSKKQLKKEFNNLYN